MNLGDGHVQSVVYDVRNVSQPEANLLFGATPNFSGFPKIHRDYSDRGG